MIISVDALACWRLTGSIHVDTQRFDVNQKVDHDKTYSFPKGDYLVHLSVDKTEQIRVHVEQKQGLILATIAKIETQLKKNEEITSSKLNRDSGLTTEVRFKLQDI
jgi:hypothetical protein